MLRARSIVVSNLCLTDKTFLVWVRSLALCRGELCVRERLELLPTSPIPRIKHDVPLSPLCSCFSVFSKMSHILGLPRAYIFMAYYGQGRIYQKVRHYQIQYFHFPLVKFNCCVVLWRMSLILAWITIEKMFIAIILNHEALCQ